MSHDGRMLTVETPGKINLALHVLARRPDGYHELDTVFQAVGLYDRLTIAPASSLEFHCNIEALAGDDNLVVRAARLLAERLDRDPNVAITLGNLGRLHLRADE